MTDQGATRFLAPTQTGVRRWWRLLRHEMRWQLVLYLRTPPAAFFTFCFPALLLVIFRWRYDEAHFARLGLSFAEVVVPSVAGIAMVIACYAGLAMEVSAAREKGILKRLRVTPLPPSAYLCARVLSVAVLGMLSAGLMLLIGVLGFGISLSGGALLRGLAVLALGGVCFSALGLAVAAAAPTAQAASAIVNFTLLPLLFFADAVVPTEQTPAWLAQASQLLPLAPFTESKRAALDGSGDWLRQAVVLAAWALVGGLLALRYFRWLPRRRTV